MGSFLLVTVQKSGRSCAVRSAFATQRPIVGIFCDPFEGAVHHQNVSISTLLAINLAVGLRRGARSPTPEIKPSI